MAQQLAMWVDGPAPIRRRAAVTLVPGADNRTAATLQRTRGDFELVRVLSPDGVGVCQIRVAGKTIRGDDFGGRVRAAFDATLQQLHLAYGPPNELVDHLVPGAYYRRPSEWLRSIVRNERTWQAHWTPPVSAPLVDNVIGITVAVRTHNEYDAYVTVQYRYGNAPGCRATAAL
ncbi:MAG: hypothetical protein FJ029_15930 [Actinobacteria bacterium]|nr:hypothetical protein [Actinomycetota bacterium]